MFYVVQEMGNRVLVYDYGSGTLQEVQDVSSLMEKDRKITEYSGGNPD